MNGKLRDKLTVPVGATDELLKQLALASEKVAEALDGKQVRKVILVPGKLVNVVIS